MSVEQSITPVEYRGIAGEPGYRVDSDGGAWTCLRKIGLPGRRGTRTVIGTTWRRLKPLPLGRYFCVNLCRDGKKKAHRIHRLVLEAFVGPCPEGMECRHKDDDKSNNRLDNLSWGTRMENAADRIANGNQWRGEQINTA